MCVLKKKTEIVDGQLEVRNVDHQLDSDAGVVFVDSDSSSVADRSDSAASSIEEVPVVVPARRSEEYLPANLNDARTALEQKRNLLRTVRLSNLPDGGAHLFYFVKWIVPN